MHFGPWIHHQSTLDAHRCYVHYGNDVHGYQQQQHHHHHHRSEQVAQEDESEQTGDETHDTMTSATSGERSSSADLFRLEFAASQWSKLVSNAECLFTKLVTSNVLPHTEQDQIEQWLCMKQEYEECITSDDTASLHGYAENTRRSLERIEEVTETEERTDESVNKIESKRDLNSENESGISEEEEDDDVDDDEEDEVDEEDDDEEEEDQSDGSSENPDFLEKLDERMERFKLETDRLVDSRREDFSSRFCPIGRATRAANANEYVPVGKPIAAVRNPNSRRNSMHPGSEMCNEIIAFNGNLKLLQNQTLEITELNGEATLEKQQPPQKRKSSRTQKDNSPDLLIDALKSNLGREVSEPMRALKTLMLNHAAKEGEVKKIQADLDGAYKRIEELQSMIEMKEKFIADMIHNKEVRTTAKRKFQRKHSKLEEEYLNSRQQLAQAEKVSLYRDVERKSSSSSSSAACRKEVERHKNRVIHYEERMLDIEMMKQIAGDSAKRIHELELSLNSSRKQMEKLKKQLRREEERKRQLEDELAEDQRKRRELEDKYNLTASKLKEMQSESEDERNNPKAKPNNNNNNEKEDEDETENESKSKKKDLLEVSARISHLRHVLKEKSMDLERTAGNDEKEALRHEIRNLRRTRDCLLEVKYDLMQRTLTMVENRKLLECDEAIEVIDTIVEHKNEMICGRKEFGENYLQREIVGHVAKLSQSEMITLFYKYFFKVVDLQQNAKSLDRQMDQLELHNQAIKDALTHTQINAEKKLIDMQRKYEQNMHIMYKHFAEETGSSGHEKLDKDTELTKYKRENRILRKRVADLEALLRGARGGHARNPSPVRLPAQGLKQIAPIAGGSTSRPTTKVTRERNKLIIQKTV